MFWSPFFKKKKEKKDKKKIKQAKKRLQSQGFKKKKE